VTPSRLLGAASVRTTNNVASDAVETTGTGTGTGTTSAAFRADNTSTTANGPTNTPDDVTDPCNNAAGSITGTTKAVIATNG
jgi:hypothetical protein